MLRYKDAYHTAQLTCAVYFILKKEEIFILTQHNRDQVENGGISFFNIG